MLKRPRSQQDFAKNAARRLRARAGRHTGRRANPRERPCTPFRFETRVPQHSKTSCLECGGRGRGANSGREKTAANRQEDGRIDSATAPHFSAPQLCITLLPGERAQATEIVAGSRTLKRRVSWGGRAFFFFFGGGIPCCEAGLEPPPGGAARKSASV